MTEPRFALTLNAGLLAGVLTGIAANFAHVVFGGPQGLYFPQLAPLPVFGATLAVGLALAFVWRALATRAHARRTFAILILAGAAVATALVGLTPGPAHFLRVMIPVHAVVALGVFLVIPRAMTDLAE